MDLSCRLLHVGRIRPLHLDRLVELFHADARHSLEGGLVVALLLAHASLPLYDQEAGPANIRPPKLLAVRV